MARHLHGYDSLESILDNCKVSLFQFFVYTEEVLGCGYKRKYPKVLDIPRKVMIIQAFSLLGYNCMEIKRIIEKKLYLNKKWIDSLDKEYGVVPKGPIVRKINDGTFDIDNLKKQVNQVFDEYFDNYFLDMFKHNKNTRITGYTLYDILEEFTRFVSREFLDDKMVLNLLSLINSSCDEEKLMLELEELCLTKYNLPLSLVGFVLACDYKTWKDEKEMIKGYDNFRGCAKKILDYSYERTSDYMVNVMARFYQTVEDLVISKGNDTRSVDEACNSAYLSIKKFIPKCKKEYVVKTLFVLCKLDKVEEDNYQDVVKVIRHTFTTLCSSTRGSLKTYEKPVLYGEEHSNYVEQLHIA